jgi:hypothetical protein
MIESPSKIFVDPPLIEIAVPDTQACGTLIVYAQTETLLEKAKLKTPLLI